MRKAFTVTELLIVVTVIALLASITIVGYATINNNAIDASLKGDLKKASTHVSLGRLDNGVYPSSIDDFEVSEGNLLEYTFSNSDGTYCIMATNNNLQDTVYKITEKDQVEEGEC